MEATGTRIVRELPLGQPARLHFRGDHISVSILPAPDGVQGRMTVELPDAEDTVDVDVSERGGVVFVTVEQRDRLHRVLRARWKDRWGVVCRLELPSGVEAMIETAAGKIEARSLSGTFDLRTDAGQVVLAYLSGRLRVQTNAGKIDCTGFRGGIEATTNAHARA